jgi:hypothetical protein
MNVKSSGGADMGNPERPPPIRLRGFIVALGLVGCGQGPLEVNGVSSQTLTIKVGRELELTLQTIGPGEYAGPPLVTSGAVRFLDVRLGAPNPAGPRQRFRFKAMQLGVAIIVFQHTAQGPTIEDTVNVQ